MLESYAQLLFPINLLSLRCVFHLFILYKDCIYSMVIRSHLYSHCSSLCVVTLTRCGRWAGNVTAHSVVSSASNGHYVFVKGAFLELGLTSMLSVRTCLSFLIVFPSCNYTGDGMSVRWEFILRVWKRKRTFAQKNVRYLLAYVESRLKKTCKAVLRSFGWWVNLRGTGWGCCFSLYNNTQN